MLFQKGNKMHFFQLLYFCQHNNFKTFNQNAFRRSIASHTTGSKFPLKYFMSTILQ